MKIITLSNEKGGVGKSTLAVHIAAGLAQRGQRVMMIDSDAQGNTTERMGIQMQPGLYDLLVRDAEWDQVAKRVEPHRYGIVGERVPDAGVLYVLPSNKETISIAGSVANAGLLKSRIEELRDLIDVVVIDTSPTPSLLHGSIYLATDYIIYPTTCTIDSFRGLGLSMQNRQGADMIRQSQLEMPGIKVMGIVPTLYRATTMEQSENYKTLCKKFGKLVWQPMPLRTIWTETESQRAPVWALDAYHDATNDAWELIDQVEEGLKRGRTTQAG